MADYSEFNNNNYLPGVYSDIETAALNYYGAVTQARLGSTNTHSGFTFTSPTHCSTMATYRQNIQNTSPISSISAPGVGTSWQHSIPVTMPWADTKTCMTSQPSLGTALFTGAPSTYLESQVSCTSPMRAPKRKALDLPSEAPTAKIYLCTDQFANLKISPIEKQNYGLPAQDVSQAGVQFYPSARSMKARNDLEGWQRFCDVENRLLAEVDEDVNLNLTSSKHFQEGPCLKVAEGVLDAVTKTPILPRKVMEDITKPCMQIVLWKCPGEIIREIAKEEIQASSQETSAMSTTTSNVSTASISRLSETRRTEASERFSPASKENFMETAPIDTPMLDSTSASVFQPTLSPTPYAASFLPPSLSSVGLLPARTQSLISPSTSSNSSLPNDLDMFDSLDDEMQL